MKKAQMSIQIIFVLFVSIIVMFVIISLFVEWSTKSKYFVKKLAKTDEQGSLVREDFEVRSDADYARKVAQMAEVCYEYGIGGKVDGSLCYTVRYPTMTLCTGCAQLVTDELDAKGIPYSPATISYLTKKTIISYDYSTKTVVIT